MSIVLALFPSWAKADAGVHQSSDGDSGDRVLASTDFVLTVACASSALASPFFVQAEAR